MFRLLDSCSAKWINYDNYVYEYASVVAKICVRTSGAVHFAGIFPPLDT